MKKYSGNIINIFDNTIFYGEITVFEGRIFNIEKLGPEKAEEAYYLPGFIDAHVHIESSMLVPSQFAKLAVVHGTIGTVSDPHEIANVLGVKGVNFMIENGKKVPFKFCFGAPSCVPATDFESAGAVIDAEEIEFLLEKPEIGYLAEMMNFPGVLSENEEVLTKISLAKKYNKPIDGHAPALRGDAAKKYFSYGISTDHECFTLEEAEEKLKMGVKILIREGSAAKNFDALIPLADNYSAQMMFCSDDKHPDDLESGHINLLIKRAVSGGLDLFKALRMASLNPIRHYDLPVGLLREGEPADFIKINNLREFEILETYIDGRLVAEKGNSLIEDIAVNPINNFSARRISSADLKIKFPAEYKGINVIKVNDGQLVTDKLFYTKAEIEAEHFSEDNDVLKLVVLNRYKETPPAIAFIKGFGLDDGALASSVAHDSHNIIAVGVDDESIADAINMIIREKGGISAVSDLKMGVLPLPVAGLMSNKNGYEISRDYTQIDNFVKNKLGSKLKSPFMSLSFMALLVIPSLKLSDKGLFDCDAFGFTDVVVK